MPGPVDPESIYTKQSCIGMKPQSYFSNGMGYLIADNALFQAVEVSAECIKGKTKTIVIARIRL